MVTDAVSFNQDNMPTQEARGIRRRGEERVGFGKVAAIPHSDVNAVTEQGVATSVRVVNGEGHELEDAADDSALS